MAIRCKFALALVLASVSASVPAQESGQWDAGQAWETFIAKATSKDVTTALAVLDAVDYTPLNVDAAKCRDNARQLAQAQALAPVSLAVQRAALLCAEATGDHAGAERAAGMIAALARHAFREADRGAWPRPMRIVAPVDAYALLATAGLDFKYEIYPQVRPAPYFRQLIAAATPASGMERLLSFDYVDVLQVVDREDPMHGTPRLRMVYAESIIASLAKQGAVPAIDQQAVLASVSLDGADKKVDALRAAAQRGGLYAAQTWLLVCARDKGKTCADGLVDALLPLVEARQVQPTVLLATAYLEGVGVERNQASAEAMLDAADKRAVHRWASVAFAELQAALHPGKPLAPFLRQRLQAAHAAGDPTARVTEVMMDLQREDDAYALTAADEALLSDPAHNGNGEGLLNLVEWYRTRDKAKSDAYLKGAAEANNPDASRMLALRLRDAEGNKPARPETMAWLDKAAHGGDASAMYYLAWRAYAAGNPRRAEDWLMVAGMNGDISAQFFLADIWSEGYEGMSGDPARAVAVLEFLAKLDGHGPRARRSLASLSLRGVGMPKDAARARALLLQDAEKDDLDSQVMLGSLLLGDSLGGKDEVAARKWLERAIAAGSVDAMNQYGLWLHNDGKDAADRARGVQLSRQAAEKDDSGALNNLAWMLCTSTHEDVRKPAEGMPYVAKLEAVPDLDPGTVDTLAACYAAVGQYPRAVELQQQVIADMRKLPTPDLDNIKEMEARLALYRAGKPYIELPEKR